MPQSTIGGEVAPGRSSDWASVAPRSQPARSDTRQHMTSPESRVKLVVRLQIQDTLAIGVPVPWHEPPYDAPETAGSVTARAFLAHMDRGAEESQLLSEARENYGHALNIWEESFSDDDPMLAYALTGLGRTNLDMGEGQTAVELLSRALELRNHKDEDKLNLAETSLLLGRAIWTTGQDQQRAIELAIAARDTVGAAEPAAHAGLRSVLSGGPAAGFTDQLVPAGLSASNRR